MSASRKRAKEGAWLPGAANVDRGDLLPALRLATMVACRNANAPALGHVAMEAVGEVIDLYACNLEIEVQISVRAEVSQPFHVTAPARELAAFVAAMDGGTLTLDAGRDGVLSVLGAGCVARFCGVDPVDVPELSAGTTPGEMTIGSDVLASALRRVKHAAAKEGTARRGMAGVHFHQRDGSLMVVATDGHRMAMVGLSAGPGGVVWPEPVTVPIMAVPLLLAVLSGPARPVTVRASASRFVLMAGAVRVVVEGVGLGFPDYERAHSAEGRARFTVARNGMMAALRRVGAICGNDLIRRMSPAPGGLLMFGRGGDAAVVEAFTPIIDGAPLPRDVGINGQYLREMLDAVAGDVEVGVAEDAAEGAASTPLVFRDLADPRATYVIMPMRL